jgi:hypothetical protein
MTPGPWKWEDGELFAPECGVCVLTCGTAKNGMPYVSVTDADRSMIAASPAMAEALEAAGHLLNHLNTVVIAYLEGKLSKEAFISAIIPFSDGPDRQRVAKLMNDALFMAHGETK